MGGGSRAPGQTPSGHPQDGRDGCKGIRYRVALSEIQKLGDKVQQQVKHDDKPSQCLFFVNHLLFSKNHHCQHRIGSQSVVTLSSLIKSDSPWE